MESNMSLSPKTNVLPSCLHTYYIVHMRIFFSSVDVFVLQVANAVLRDYIFVHLDDNIDKFNLLMSVSLVLPLLNLSVIRMLF